MSIFSDFQRVWQARFPNQSLPTDWEDEVRSNLDKHQQKVQHLRDELAKEEFYVEYLERLLSDFESSRKHVRQSRVDKLPQVNRPSSVYSHDANCDDVSFLNNLIFRKFFHLQIKPEIKLNNLKSKSV